MKFTPLIKQLNWVDIFILILIIRITYIGIKRGLVTELFKILGTILSIFLSMHYYPKLGNFIHERSPLPLGFADFISFLALVIMGHLFFLMLRTTFLLLVRIEPQNILNKWGGLILGILRGLLAVSLFISILCLSTIKYFEKSAKRSFSSNYLSKIAPKTYEFLFDNLFIKFSPKERLNEEIFNKVLQ